MAKTPKALRQWRSRIVGHGEEDPEQLLANPDNWRIHPAYQEAALEGVLADVGWVQHVIVNRRTQHVVDGHLRVALAIRRGEPVVPVVYVDLDPEEERKILATLDPIAAMAGMDKAKLAELLQSLQTDQEGLAALLTQLRGEAAAAGTPVAQKLTERFLIPPFSVLDARQGYWQERKAAWIALGIKGAEGRTAPAIKGQASLPRQGRSRLWASGGTSVFDPVLCEVVYKWFAPPKGHILDPFAGEATKGIVAAYLGYPYTGIELREEQVAANEAQAKAIGVTPRWLRGDSTRLKALVPPKDQFDLIFTSPPYYDLETYSDDGADGSTKQTYADFLRWYRGIFAQAVERLRANRFVVVKVGEVRDQLGAYHNLVGDTIACFRSLGLHYYNEAVLITAVGSLGIRAVRSFKTRKLGKTHQNVLVFYKGDLRRIPRIYPYDFSIADLSGEADSSLDHS